MSKITVLKSKLSKVIVTAASVDYVGSITIDEDLMDAAGLREYEKVEVNGATTPSRINTYVIKGKRGSGCIEMNGGASLHFKKGDEVHVLCFMEIDEKDGHNTLIVTTDKENKIESVSLKTISGKN